MTSVTRILWVLTVCVGIISLAQTWSSRATATTAATTPSSAMSQQVADRDGELIGPKRQSAGAQPVEPARPSPATPTPSLTGLEPVASGVAAARFLEPAEPAPASHDPEGAFRFLCAPSHNAYDDPIIYPGQPGKSHLHTFFGNTKANASSTYASLRTTGESTCNNLLNRSSYWIAAMMNGRGQVVMPDYLVVYYKRLPADSPECRRMGKACVPLPHGLRYVFGYNMQNPAKSDAATGRWWNCDGPGAVPGHFRSIPEAAKGCPVGARLGASIVSPNCWNGKDLDSPDHRSHMAISFYHPDKGLICPPTHPYILPQFTLGAWYAVDASLDRSGDMSTDAKTWYLASDRMPGMANAVPGTTLHSDWFGAWEDGVMNLWTANCIDKRLSCDAGNLGNGTRLKGLAGYSMKAEPRLVPAPASAGRNL